MFGGFVRQDLGERIQSSLSRSEIKGRSDPNSQIAIEHGGMEPGSTREVLGGWWKDQHEEMFIDNGNRQDTRIEHGRHGGGEIIGIGRVIEGGPIRH